MKHDVAELLAVLEVLGNGDSVLVRPTDEGLALQVRTLREDLGEKLEEIFAAAEGDRRNSYN